MISLFSFIPPPPLRTVCGHTTSTAAILLYSDQLNTVLQLCFLDQLNTVTQCAVCYTVTTAHKSLIFSLLTPSLQPNTKAFSPYGPNASSQSYPLPPPVLVHAAIPAHPSCIHLHIRERQMQMQQCIVIFFVLTRQHHSILSHLDALKEASSSCTR